MLLWFYLMLTSPSSLTLVPPRQVWYSLIFVFMMGKHQSGELCWLVTALVISACVSVETSYRGKDLLFLEQILLSKSRPHFEVNRVTGVSLRGRSWGFSPSTQALSPTYILEICIGVVWKRYEIPRLLCLDPRVPKMVMKPLGSILERRNLPL